MTECSVGRRVSVDIFTLTLPSPLKGEDKYFRPCFLFRWISFFIESRKVCLLINTRIRLKDPSPQRGEG